MKYTLLSIILSLNCFIVSASEVKFGQICITPYAAQNSSSVPVNDILIEKMTQMLLSQGVAADQSERFIIVPHITINDISTTATIPSKTSVRITVSLAIGDGVDGIQFSNLSVNLSGVGNNKENAILSAIRKLKTNAPDIASFIRTGTDRIVEYYNNNAPILIQKAQASMASSDYEQAVIFVSSIPAVCNYYHEAQSILRKCGAGIIERNNNLFLRNAQSAWAADPTITGAEVAKSYLSQIIVPTPLIAHKIENLNAKIEQKLTQEECRRYEFAKMQASSQAEIQKAEIQASAAVASAFFSSIPKLIISALSWF